MRCAHQAVGDQSHRDFESEYIYGVHRLHLTYLVSDLVKWERGREGGRVALGFNKCFLLLICGHRTCSKTDNSLEPPARRGTFSLLSLHTAADRWPGLSNRTRNVMSRAQNLANRWLTLTCLQLFEAMDQRT